jgi:ABC-type transporter Mla maintaining outer membrane lipid asymmetry permease subunit MlaE
MEMMAVDPIARVVAPRFAYYRPIGLALLPILVLLIAFGLARIIRCLRHDFDIISFLAFASLLIFFVILIYTGVFLAALLFLR